MLAVAARLNAGEDRGAVARELGLSVDALLSRLKRARWGGASDSGAAESATSPDVRDVDRITVGTTASKAAVTYAIADMQLGEREFLLGVWEAVSRRVAERLVLLRPLSLRIVVNGDAITGGGVFRRQEQRVLLPTTDPQVAYAGHKIQRLTEDLARVCGLRREHVEVVLVDGNHDTNQGGDNLTYQLALLLHLLGVNARYSPRVAYVNLAPPAAEPYTLMAFHGFGNSAYYPASYALIRALKDWLVQRALWTPVETGVVRRVLTGHTHWLTVGLDLAGVQLDVCGGWTVPRRHGLGPAMRPVGGILYIHDGAHMSAETVRPTAAELATAVDDPYLDELNMADIAQGLRAVKEAMVRRGLVATNHGYGGT